MAHSSPSPSTAAGEPPAEEIIAHCRATLGPLTSPRRVYFRADLPLLPSGKPDLRALSDWVEGQT